ALERWRAWAESGTPAAKPEPVLNDETFRAAAIEIMSGDRARAERGMQRMEAFGLDAVARIENFIDAQTSLEPAPRAQLKSAQYRLVLLTALPRQAAALARDLSLGTLEQQSTALGALGDGGPAVLPILGDFISAADPLVRETAVDSAFKAGGAHAVPLILARLGEPAIEQTESVLHSMLRGLGKHGSNAAHVETIARFLGHPSENVVITALEAVAENKHGEVLKPLAARLDDPRWRVRATALEALGKRGAKGLEKEITARLDDADSFVRVSAVGALGGDRSSSHFGGDDEDTDSDAGKNVLQKLTPFFLKYDDLKPPILKLYVSKSATAPPAEVTDALWKAPTETLLLALDLFDNRDQSFGGSDEKRGPWKPGYVARFAPHPNADVAAAALRILAAHGRFTAQLLTALSGDDETRRDAVLDVLALPSAPALPEAKAAAPNPALDQLYNALAGPASAAAPVEESAPPAEMRAVLEKFLRTGSPRQQFAAGCVLLAQRHEEAARSLLASYETLSALDCRRIAASLGPAVPWGDGPFLELALRVLRHPAGDVRETAIHEWLASAKSAGLGALLGEFARPGSLLEPDDIYDYYMHRILKESASRAPVVAFAKQVLGNDAAVGRKVFAMVLLGQTQQVHGQNLERFLDDPNPVLRRAAFRALGRAAVEPRLNAILADREAIVREVVPFIAAPHEGWMHRFDDAHSAEDGEEFGRSRGSGSDRKFGAWATNEPVKGAAVDLLPAVEKLANDPADSVRFAAQFALMRLGRPIDPAAFATLLAAQNEETSRARYRVKSWVTENYKRLGKGYAVLVPLLDFEGEYGNEKKALAHFGLDAAQSPYTSFQAIAALAPAGKKSAENAIAAPAPETPATGQTFRVLFFYKPGCRDCERVRDQLNRHATAFPQMTLEERNIESPSEALLNESLATRFRIRDTLHQVAPAVFTQTGALVRDGIDFAALGTLLREAAAVPPDAAWADAAQPEIAAAETRIVQRYAALDRGVVATAGLLDGINPCAFATIIFL
ncbi:MAG: HEAT repeat domain-containing protein, partial [Chthoniobacteraceae bacterium]